MSDTRIEATEQRLSEKLGFTHLPDGGFTFNENGDVAWKTSEYREIAESLWRELLSTTEQLERIRKAAQRAAGEFEEILSYCAVEKDPILRKQELKSIREVREALRKELL